MERDLWHTMRNELGPLGDLQRIENLCRNGMPDVNGCIDGHDFWCELKWLEGWPKNESTVVPFPTYTKQQRVWIRRRCQEAGARNVFLLVQVETPREFLLFDWEAAVYQVGLTVKHILQQRALIYSQGKFPTEKLVEWIKEGHTAR
jgi:hypothetical protein